MNKDIFPIQIFQTFYVSKEVSNCPLLANVFRFIKKNKDIPISSISMRYGKRVLINADDVNFGETGKESFIEIVDYDPFKKLLLIMGPGEPVAETPVHWFIHHARKDINAVLIINKETKGKNIDNKIPISNKEQPLGSIEKIKEIMGLLRENKIIDIKNNSLLLVGKNLDEIEENYYNYLRF